VADGDRGVHSGEFADVGRGLDRPSGAAEVRRARLLQFLTCATIWPELIVARKSSGAFSVVFIATQQ